MDLPTLDHIFTKMYLSYHPDLERAVSRSSKILAEIKIESAGVSSIRSRRKRDKYLAQMTEDVAVIGAHLMQIAKNVSEIRSESMCVLVTKAESISNLRGDDLVAPSSLSD